MKLDAIIERVCRRCWRPLSREIGDTQGGHDRATLGEHMEAVNPEVVFPEGGVTGAETPLISDFVIVGM